MRRSPPWPARRARTRRGSDGSRYRGSRWSRQLLRPARRQRGREVIAPGLSEDTDYLRGLGAAEILDRNADFETPVRERHPDGVDAILDVVSFTPRDSLLADGGRLASTLGAAGEGSGRFNLMAQPTPENLQRLADLLDSGAMRVPIQKTYGLAQGDEALRDFATTHTQGKLGITNS